MKALHEFCEYLGFVILAYAIFYGLHLLLLLCR